MLSDKKTDVTEAREDHIRVLVAQIKTGQRDLMLKLWGELERLCAWYCRRLYRQLPDSFMLEYDDLYDCGYIALCDAVEHCDLNAGTKFSSYYLFYLVSSIYRENRLPQGRRGPDGKKKADPVIADHAKSLDAPLEGSDDKPTTLAEILRSPQSDDGEDVGIAGAIDRIFREELHQALERLISELSQEEQHIIRRKYYDGVDCTVIADELGISGHQVTKSEDKALIGLRHRGKDIHLEQFLDSQINYYSGTGLQRFKESCESAVERLAGRRMDLEARYEKLHGGFGRKEGDKP